MTPQGSPIFEHTGQMPDDKRAPETVCSYLSVHEALAKKSQMYTSKYAQFVIDYAVEWERVVVTRVNTALKKAEQLRVETDHYQEKVEALRQAANSSMAKGKMVDPKSAERLSRNEEKLAATKKTHDKFTNDLCILLDEVTDRSWRDLHPLLVKIAQFDMTLSDDESKSLTILNGIVNELKKMAAEHGIKPQARLKDLDTLDPTVLSTKKDGGSSNAIGGADPFLAIEGLSLGGDTSSVTSGNTKDSLSQPSFPALTSGDFALPPGSVFPQSSGGFPVMVQDSGGTSSGSGLSTLDMISMQKSAAPAPTLDQLNDVFSAGGMLTPTPMSSGMMPLQTESRGRPAPASRGVGRNYSSDSGYSTVSEASAPPPFAPPPPPPGPNAFGSNPTPPTSMGSAPPNPFGSGPPAPNPFGSGVAPAPSSYGGGMGYGSAAPPPAPMYGTSMAPAQQPYNNYGMQPPMAPHSGPPGGGWSQQPSAPMGYGQQQSMYPPPGGGGGPPPLSMYGAPPPLPGAAPPSNSARNPFDD